MQPGQVVIAADIEGMLKAQALDKPGIMSGSSKLYPDCGSFVAQKIYPSSFL